MIVESVWRIYGKYPDDYVPYDYYFCKNNYFCKKYCSNAVGKFKDLWNRDLDGENAEKRSFFRYAIFATLIFIVMVGFVNQNNIVRWIKAGFEIRNQEQIIERYSSEIKEMDRQIHGLTYSRDSLEQFARERFGLAEPGDDVYVIEK